MKKEMVLFLVMSSMTVVNAMDNDFANQKKNSTSTIPSKKTYCCIRTASVPPCEKCFVKGMLNEPCQEKQSSAEPKRLSQSQEWKRCP